MIIINYPPKVVSSTQLKNDLLEMESIINECPYLNYTTDIQIYDVITRMSKSYPTNMIVDKKTVIARLRWSGLYIPRGDQLVDKAELRFEVKIEAL